MMKIYNSKWSAAETDGNSVRVPTGKSASVLVVHQAGKNSLSYELGAGSTLILFNFYGKGCEVRSSFSLSENSRLEIRDLFTGGAKADISIPMEKKGCMLDLLAKGIIEDKQFSSYSALASVGKHASGANVNLEEHAYLLGEGARATLVPGLEIINNDVSARHASSMRELDEEQLFYLMSRGLSREEAKNEILSGFVMHEKERVKELFGYSVEL